MNAFQDAEAWLQENDVDYDTAKRNWGVVDSAIRGQGVIDWPADHYSQKTVDGVALPIGCWTVGRGSVRLQPTFDETAASRNPIDAPFGDVELIPVATGRAKKHGEAAVQDEGGDDAERFRPRRRLVNGDRHRRVSRVDAIILVSVIYLREMQRLQGVHLRSMEDASAFARRWLDAIEPRRGRANDSTSKAIDVLAHVLAWLHYERGVPQSLLIEPSLRAKQSVSNLISRHESTYNVEAQPWAARRRAHNERGVVSVGNWGRVLVPRPELFYPNRPCPDPYWADLTPKASRRAQVRGPWHEQPGPSIGTAGSAVVPAPIPHTFGGTSVDHDSVAVVDDGAPSYRCQHG